MVQTKNIEILRGFQEEKTKGVSPRILSLVQELGLKRSASSWMGAGKFPDHLKPKKII